MSAPPEVSAPGISIREFARRDGCSEKLVRRALESGRLQRLADGTLDASLVGTGWRKTNRHGADSADVAADTADRVSAPATAAAIAELLEPQPHGGSLLRLERPSSDVDPAEVIASADDFVTDVLAGNFASYVLAERIKENGLALKHVLAARQLAGSLVSLETASAVLFDTHRAARDSWLNWPVRIGPLLAAELGVDADRVTEALTAHVHQHLAQLGEPEPDFADPGG